MRVVLSRRYDLHFSFKQVSSRALAEHPAVAGFTLPYAVCYKPQNEECVRAHREVSMKERKRGGSGYVVVNRPTQRKNCTHAQNATRPFPSFPLKFYLSYLPSQINLSLFPISSSLRCPGARPGSSADPPEGRGYLPCRARGAHEGRARGQCCCRSRSSSCE